MVAEAYLSLFRRVGGVRRRVQVLEEVQSSKLGGHGVFAGSSSWVEIVAKLWVQWLVTPKRVGLVVSRVQCLRLNLRKDLRLYDVLC